MKFKRQQTILKLVRENDLHTHDELLDKLKEEGYDIKQATVSRDIKELGLIKVPLPDGSYAYALPNSPDSLPPNRMSVASRSVTNVVAAMHTVVVRTYPGMAPAAGATVDLVMGKRIIGSIAGDDTLLIITESPEQAQETADELKILFKVEK